MLGLCSANERRRYFVTMSPIAGHKFRISPVLYRVHPTKYACNTKRSKTVYTVTTVYTVLLCLVLWVYFVGCTLYAYAYSMGYIVPVQNTTKWVHPTRYTAWRGRVGADGHGSPCANPGRRQGRHRPRCSRACPGARTRGSVVWTGSRPVSVC